MIEPFFSSLAVSSILNEAICDANTPEGVDTVERIAFQFAECLFEDSGRKEMCAEFLRDCGLDNDTIGWYAEGEDDEDA